MTCCISSSEKLEIHKTRNLSSWCDFHHQRRIYRKSKTVLTFEQSESLGHRLFHFLRNKKLDSIEEHFCCAESPLLDSETASFMISVGFVQSIEKGTFTLNDPFHAWKNSKEGLLYLVEHGEPTIFANIYYPLMRSVLGFGDLAFADELITLGLARNLELDVEGIFYFMLDAMFSDMSHAEMDLFDQMYAEFYSNELIPLWRGRIERLRRVGLETGIDIGTTLAEFVPDTPNDERIYADLVSMFISEGFLMDSGMPSEDNPVFNRIALQGKLEGEMMMKPQINDGSSYRGKL